jgi:heterodisulfide reductase subunit C
MQLACETIVEPAMQVTFLGFLDHHRHHTYQIEDFDDAWDLLEQVNGTFPEAAHCRHCGGCDATCPRGLEVQRGVNLLVVGSVQEASDIFADCVMCNLCTRACPEHICPNRLGVLGRRIVASHGLHSPNLLLRLDQIRSGALTVDVDAIEAPAARGDH